MKVELENIRIRVSPLSRTVYAGTLNKMEYKWISKVDIDEQFNKAAISKWIDNPEIIDIESVGTFEITVKRIK